jgi:predicted DNA-binding protein (MmcQ/YjbR family)
MALRGFPTGGHRFSRRAQHMTKTKGSRLGEAIRKRALSYPETHEELPWGESAFKVKGKTFVFMRDGDDGLSFSVKLPSSRDLALALPGSEPTQYGLGKKGWVTLRPTSKTSMGVLHFLIDEGFRAVAPKRLVAQLPDSPRLPE